MPVQGPAIPKVTDKRPLELVHSDGAYAVAEVTRHTRVFLARACRQPAKIRTGNVVIEQVLDLFFGETGQQHLLSGAVPTVGTAVSCNVGNAEPGLSSAQVSTERLVPRRQGDCRYTQC